MGGRKQGISLVVPYQHTASVLSTPQYMVLRKSSAANSSPRAIMLCHHGHKEVVPYLINVSRECMCTGKSTV